MRVWLINPYGPLPSEAWRAYCYPQIAEVLTGQGHEVIWWTSNFAHHFKKFRSVGWADVDVWNGFCIRLVPTNGYRKNIGIGRFFRDAVFALRTYLRGRSDQRPDLIIHSESPLTFGFAAHALARHHGCPIVYHQMDLWPELIVDAAPEGLQRLLRAAMWPVFRARRHNYSCLSGVTALAKPYLEAVHDVAPILRCKPSAVIYNGINVTAFRTMMKSKYVSTTRFPEKKPGDLWAVFAGSLGPSYDIGVMCDVSRYLAALDSNVHIVIAGDGPQRTQIESTVRCDSGPANLFYLGQLSPAELAALYSQCDIGLCAYSASSNVEMPDKIYDYTAAGLPVVVSLRGEVSRIVAEFGIGLSYTGGSANDLLHRLIELTSDHEAMQKMAKASFDLGLQFDKNIQYRKFIDVVNQATS